MGKEPETMLRFGTIGTGWIANSYVDGALDSGLSVSYTHLDVYKRQVVSFLFDCMAHVYFM